MYRVVSDLTDFVNAIGKVGRRAVSNKMSKQPILSETEVFTITFRAARHCWRIPANVRCSNT